MGKLGQFWKADELEILIGTKIFNFGVELAMKNGLQEQGSIICPLHQPPITAACTLTAMETACGKCLDIHNRSIQFVTVFIRFMMGLNNLSPQVFLLHMSLIWSTEMTTDMLHISINLQHISICSILECDTSLDIWKR